MTGDNLPEHARVDHAGVDHAGVDHADVQLLPPTLLFALLLASLALDWLIPLPLFEHATGIIIGIPLGVASIWLILKAAGLFIKAGTAVPPNRPTKLIVSDGLFAYSRNPIYIGFLMAHIALALLFNSLFMALFFLPFYLYLQYYVIPREEAYLERKFKQTYLDYKQQVRRWI